MPRCVSEAQPLVSDEADESEAFAPLALGKKIDREGARNRAPFFMAREGAGKTILERAGEHLSKSMPLRWLPTVKCPL